jgi:hypothetical protein
MTVFSVPKKSYTYTLRKITLRFGLVAAIIELS